MKRIPFVPPIKCQGIKTKLVNRIISAISNQSFDRWVEPFCGSCVVPLNVQPKKALLTDANEHLIRFYKEIQQDKLTPKIVKEFLESEGSQLLAIGEPYYYTVRQRFNDNPSSLDFLFLNRSCFNGVMRFNRSGKFNVPYCHKPNRFAQSYVTKITNQVKRISEVIHNTDWTFAVANFRDTLSLVDSNDFVYADPPYAGRHVDYFNSWSGKDEQDLAEALKALPCHFILSTWHSNQFRENPLISVWDANEFHVMTKSHFYHVGSTEDLRHPMTEALVTNYPVANLEDVELAEEVFA